MKKYNGLIDEILYYSERSKDGRWIIPIEVDWDYTLTKCSSWEKETMELNEEGFEVMKRWSKEYNVGWILNTMRHDEILQEPLQILKDKGIELYGVRKNPKQEEGASEVTKSFAIMSIDDRNLGVPVQWLEGCNRPHVDWVEVDKIGAPILGYMAKQLEKVKL